MTALAENRLDERKYGRLLARTLPRAIETESDYERSLDEVNRLMSKGEDHLTPEENPLLENYCLRWLRNTRRAASN